MKRNWLFPLFAAATAVAVLTGCAAAAPSGSSNALSASSATITEDDGSLHMTQAGTVTSKTYEKKDTYAQFMACAAPFSTIPGLNQGMVPQGMGVCTANGRIYISGYFSEDAKLPSAIVALDAKTGDFTAEYYLYNADGTAFTSHVGGVAVTDQTLYVSAKLDNDGSYSVAAIPLADLNETGSQKVTVQTVISVPVSPSFLNYSAGTLWVGNFYHPDKDYDLSPEINHTTATADGDYGCYIVGYDLSNGGEEAFLAAAGGSYPTPDYILAAPDRIQGMTMLDNGIVVLSQSYGRKNDSNLLCYRLSLEDAPDTKTAVGSSGEVDTWVLDASRATKSVTAMPMTEALSAIPGENTCYVLFESGAMHYSDGKYRTDCLWKFTPDEA